MATCTSSRGRLTIKPTRGGGGGRVCEVVSRVLLCLQGLEKGPRTLRSPCGWEGLTYRRCGSAVPGRCLGGARRLISTLKVKEVFLWERLDGEAIFFLISSLPSVILPCSSPPLPPSLPTSLPTSPPCPLPCHHCGQGLMSGSGQFKWYIPYNSTFLW